MKIEPKLKSFWPIHVNCDCASYDWARRRAPRNGEWIRCMYCHRQLGDMEIIYYPKVRAYTVGEAWEMAKKLRREQCE